MADPSEDPKVFVLARELSEVHLLLDNIAANPTTNLSALTARSRPAWLADNWIEQVCGVNWPPADSERDQAQQAALLIKAKDYLNSLTYPASGATIAFTLLVTQESPDRRGLRAAGQDDDEQTIADAPSRRSMACAAYPDLAAKAARFRRMMGWMSVFLLAWLLLTCLLSWYVAFGNAQLSDLATARANLAVAQTRVDAAETAKAVDAGSNNGGSNDAGSNDGGTQDGETVTGDARIVGFCDRIRLIPPVKARDGAMLRQYDSAEQRQACNGLDAANAEVTRIERSLAKWLFRLDATRTPGRITDGPAIAAYAASLANIIGSAMLPVLYGFLGAAAAVVRSLSRKTRASLLTPRDLQLSVQQLALGAVVGACIGLFIGQPASGEAGAGLIGPVALSSSALSFIAGFGVDAVFETLEALITRIFNIATPARPADPPPPALEPG